MNTAFAQVCTCLCLSVLMHAGCREARPPVEAEVKTAGTGMILVDSDQRSVHLQGPTQRVLSLAPVASELMAHIGATDLLVGRTENCNFPPEISAIPSIGRLFPPNYEKITATRPHIILMASGQLEVRKRLKAMGLVVFVVQPANIGEIGTMLITLGKMTGRTRQALQQADLFNQRHTSIVSKVPVHRPRVFWEIWAKPLQTVGPKGFIGDLIRQAGGKNIITENEDPWPRVSNEYVVSKNPQVVIASNQSSRSAMLKKTRTGWDQTDAIRNQRIFLPPNMDTVTRPGPRILDGLEWLISVLHPTQAGD